MYITSLFLLQFDSISLFKLALYVFVKQCVFVLFINLPITSAFLEESMVLSRTYSGSFNSELWIDVFTVVFNLW